MSIDKLNYKKQNHTTMNERKCDLCDDLVEREYEGQFLCYMHLQEARSIANAKYEKMLVIKKIAIVLTGAGIVIGGAVVIMQFFPIFS